MPLFIKCSLHQNGSTQEVHFDDTLFLSSFPQATCQVTDIRSIAEKWISHLHSYRWVCKEPFYIVCSNAVNTVTLFFFFFPVFISTLDFGRICSFWLQRHIPEGSCLIVELKFGRNTSPRLCPHNKYAQILAESGDTICTRRSACLNH